MHLRRAIYVANVIATAAAQPHAVSGNQRLFPLDSARAGHDATGSGTDKQPARSHAAMTDLSPRASSPLALATAPSTPVGRAVAVRDLRRAAAGGLPWVDDYSAIFHPREWDAEFGARMVALLVGLVAPAAAYNQLVWVAQMLGFTMVWGEIVVPILIAVAAGQVIIWLGNRLVDFAVGKDSDAASAGAVAAAAKARARALRSVQRVAAAAGLRVRFVSTATKDAMIAQAKAQGNPRLMKVG